MPSGSYAPVSPAPWIPAPGSPAPWLPCPLDGLRATNQSNGASIQTGVTDGRYRPSCPRDGLQHITTCPVRTLNTIIRKKILTWIQICCFIQSRRVHIKIYIEKINLFLQIPLQIPVHQATESYYILIAFNFSFSIKTQRAAN